jgi:ABC-type molybdate transport system permease subunit
MPCPYLVRCKRKEGIKRTDRSGKIAYQMLSIRNYSGYTNVKMSMSTRNILAAARVTFFRQIGQFPPSLDLSSLVIDALAGTIAWSRNAAPKFVFDIFCFRW